jgi:hypothetical protein
VSDADYKDFFYELAEIVHHYKDVRIQAIRRADWSVEYWSVEYRIDADDNHGAAALDLQTAVGKLHGRMKRDQESEQQKAKIERIKKLQPGDRFTVVAHPAFPLNQLFTVVEVGPQIVTYDPIGGLAYLRQQATVDWAADHFVNMETPSGWKPVK